MSLREDLKNKNIFYKYNNNDTSLKKSDIERLLDDSIAKYNHIATSL